jgi:hypothetical protein
VPVLLHQHHPASRAYAAKNHSSAQATLDAAVKRDQRDASHSFLKGIVSADASSWKRQCVSSVVAAATQSSRTQCAIPTFIARKLLRALEAVHIITA